MVVQFRIKEFSTNPVTFRYQSGDVGPDSVAAATVVFVGEPGITTDAVAALVSERVKADLLIKGTDQEGIYTKDPRKYMDAVKLDRLSFDELSEVFSESKHKAGLHQIVDPEAIKVLKRERVKLVVVNGFKSENILAAVQGEKVGTVVE